MIRLFECRNCGMLTTERHDTCPACRHSAGANDQGGSAFRGLNARDFMELIHD